MGKKQGSEGVPKVTDGFSGAGPQLEPDKDERELLVYCQVRDAPAAV
jgi:hypothetical protein